MGPKCNINFKGQVKMLAASGENCETGFSIKFLQKTLAKQQNEVRWKLIKHIGET